MIPILIAGPALEPVSLAEAKAWLRIDGSDEDALISTLVTSARLVLEAHTHQLFLEQSWKILYDAWPSGGASTRCSPSSPRPARARPMAGSSDDPRRSRPRYRRPPRPRPLAAHQGSPTR